MVSTTHKISSVGFKEHVYNYYIENDYPLFGQVRIELLFAAPQSLGYKAKTRSAYFELLMRIAIIGLFIRTS